ncbi:MAG: PAS domain S-box protein, partial [Gammaproteobacteria bacterium]
LCEILGYGREELLGMTFLDLTPPEDVDASLDRVRRMLDGELDPYSLERRYIRKDGSRFWARLVVSLARKASGEPDYFICVVEDITERKLVELVPDPLTDGEMDVLRLVAQGRTNREIARELGYSVGTVNSRIGSILNKLGVENRRGAVEYAVQIGLLPSPTEASEDRITRKLW